MRCRSSPGGLTASDTSYLSCGGIGAVAVSGSARFRGIAETGPTSTLAEENTSSPASGSSGVTRHATGARSDRRMRG